MAGDRPPQPNFNLQFEAMREQIAQISQVMSNVQERLGSTEASISLHQVSSSTSKANTKGKEVQKPKGEQPPKDDKLVKDMSKTRIGGKIYSTEEEEEEAENDVPSNEEEEDRSSTKNTTTTC